MNIYAKLFCLLLVILTGINTACAAAPVPVAPELVAGQVEAIQTGTSIWILHEVIRGAANAFAIGKGGITMFAAPMPNAGGWGTVVLDLNTEVPLLKWGICSGGTGTLYGCNDMADLISRALNKGYNFVPASSLPAAFVRDLHSAALWLTTAPLTILVLPIGASEIPYEILPDYGIEE